MHKRKQRSPYQRIADSELTLPDPPRPDTAAPLTVRYRKEDGKRIPPSSTYMIIPAAGVAPPLEDMATLDRITAEYRATRALNELNAKADAIGVKLDQKAQVQSSDDSTIPSRNGLRFDRDRQRIAVDGKWYDLGNSQTKMLAML